MKLQYSACVAIPVAFHTSKGKAMYLDILEQFIRMKSTGIRLQSKYMIVKPECVYLYMVHGLNNCGAHNALKYQK
jgi:hypothetical protein